MKAEKNNFNPKPITEFNTCDTLYIQKKIGGYTYTFLVQFVKFENGIVTGTIIEIQPNHTKGIFIKGVYCTKGVDISSRISNCYTYQKGYGCHFFEKEAIGWVCR